jgi:hypothetical protein
LAKISRLARLSRFAKISTLGKFSREAKRVFEIQATTKRLEKLTGR